ncbi:MATE-like super family protein [Candidatus Megaera polyxenophila]|jgi:O-antigen/teichoic acid export membrane protein|nr:MATE-like super family protein [Candidatus Megaera polyxenophila]
MGHLTKNHIELILNLLSFGIIGGSGIFLNIIIVNYYNISILGLFNQFLALYFIFSQLTTFGIHQSVLAYMPSSRKPDIVLSSALLIVLLFSSGAAFIIYFLLKYLIHYLQIINLETSIKFLIPVLILFSVNKVLTNALLGLGHMNKFAIANASRFILLLVSVVIHILIKAKYETITSAFIFAEVGVLILLLAFNFSTKDNIPKLKKVHILLWIKKHFSFGKYALISGFILDLNSKIDILILSLFVSQSEVGIYAFAAMLGEGFYQFALIFRNLNTNKFALAIHKDKSLKFLKKNSLLFWQSLFICFAGIISIILYKFLVSLVTSNSDIVSKGFFIYSIYASGVIISSKWIILDNILILKKEPKFDNYVRISSLIINFSFSLILVQFIGILGAAIAIFFSLLTTALLLKYFSQ